MHNKKKNMTTKENIETNFPQASQILISGPFLFVFIMLFEYIIIILKKIRG